MTVLDDLPAVPPAAPEGPGRMRRLVRGRAGDPAWARPSLLGLLAATALLYLWNLSASGNGNEFYAAAVQAGTKSWKAMFFGSIDSSNFITVDKPPASLWVMEISGRIFGFSSWSMLAPQALEGVAAVALLYAAVRRWFGPAAGLIAGAALAVTPVAVLMFRFNNPDALMTLLCVAAAYCTVRAIERAGTKWLLLAGVVMGFAFLAKSLQPFTVLPGLALAYLICAPTTMWRRIWQTLLGGVGVILGAGWWVLIATVWPASSRPYIGGSGNNTVLGLAFGYNGLGRITGNESGTGAGGGGGGGGGGPTFSGSTGLGRLFNSEMGTQIAWLLPAALLAIVAGLWVSARAPRTDRTRAAVIVWGGWLLVTGLVLSYASGIIHAYYTVQLAPAIAALVGIGTVLLWRRRADINARLTMAIGVVLLAVTSYTLLDRDPTWHPELRYLIVAAAALVVVIVAAAPAMLRRMALVVPIAAVIAGLGASSAYALSTASTAHTGSTPSAGPAGSSGGFGGGGFAGGGGSGGRRGSGDGGLPGGTTGGFGGGTPPAGGPGGSAPTGTRGTTGSAPTGGGFGGGSTSANSAVSALLKATDTTWAAATIGSQSAASLELASGGKAVMAIGGWSGSDDAPTLAQFEKLVGEGKIHYFITGGGAGGGGQAGSSAITSWVSSHFSSSSVGGTTVYDLTKATS